MKLGGVVFGRYWLLLILINCVVVGLVGSALAIGDQWWYLLLCVAAGGYSGHVGSRIDTRRAGRTPAKPTAPGKPGLLPLEEFARVCEKYATPQVDPEPDLPDALPLALRDPELAKVPKRRAEIEEQAKQLRDMRKDVGRYSSSLMHRWHEAEDAMADNLAKLAERQHRTNRGYVGLTHCPEGHIGEHWLGEVADHEGRPMVSRTCRYSRCGATWLESAWTEQAS